MKVGQIVRVKVLSADAKVKRIALSIKALEAPAEPKVKHAAKPEQKKPDLQDQLSSLTSRFRTR